MLKLSRQNRGLQGQETSSLEGASVAQSVDRVEPYTYIHKGTVLEGGLQATGRVRIAGTVKGDLTVEGVVEVTEGGLVAGKRLEADTVVIIGEVRASLKVGRLEIWKKGVLQGDVQANAIDIEEGATFIGRSDMRPVKERAANAPQAAKLSSSLSIDAEDLLAPHVKKAANKQASKKVVRKTEAA